MRAEHNGAHLSSNDRECSTPWGYTLGTGTFLSGMLRMCSGITPASGIKPGWRIVTTLRRVASSMGIYWGFSCRYPIVLSFSPYIPSVPAINFLPTFTPLRPGGSRRLPTHTFLPSWAQAVVHTHPAPLHRWPARWASQVMVHPGQKGEN